MHRRAVIFFIAACISLCSVGVARAVELRAGVAKVDITNTDGPVNDRMYARALALVGGETALVIVTLDVVAIGEIGSIGNEFLGNVRATIEKDYGIKPSQVMINASHCHGIPCKDVEARTIEAVRIAVAGMMPVRMHSGAGREDRIMENRRLTLKSGKEVDVRHAYALPPDEEVAKVGPVDPEIGVLRLDRHDGSTLAVVYNFACHPIQGVASKGNTADITGFSSKVIEDNLSKGTVALFVQGCGGDINPVYYKDVHHPRDAEPLGNMLGLSTLAAVRRMKPPKDEVPFKVINEKIALPRADFAERIELMEAEKLRLAGSLGGTSLNFKTFLPLAVKYNASEFPSYYSHGYLHQKARGRDDLEKLDAENRRNIEQYIRNIHTMERLTRLNTNLRLLKKNHAKNVAAGKRTIDCEMVGFRVGDFRMITFPGELVVQIGLNIKKASPHKQTFVAGYTNGYIYYAPTEEQMRNVGGAQEDSDCLLGPGWQNKFETKALEMLRQL